MRKEREKMKKYLKTVLCTVVCLLMTFTSVSAATTMEIVDWHGDYKDGNNPKLTVTFKSPAPYQQQVIAVIYPESDNTPTFEESLRMSEITISGSGEKSIEFDITNEFSENDFAYKIVLQGNGHMKDESIVNETVYVINPGRIPGIISEFKNASITTMPGVISKVMAPLQLADETDATLKAKKVNVMYKMKDTFNTLEDVRNAWYSADILVYIGESTSTADGVAQRLISNADILGININDTDFKLYVDEDPFADDEGNDIADNNELCEAILAHAPSYNNNAGVQSVEELQDLIGELLGLIVINDSSEDFVDDAFDKYKGYFDISSDTMSSYNKLATGDQGKALRAIYNKNFSDTKQLITAFTTAVNTLSAGGDIADTPVIIVPDGNSGNPGGSGGSGISVPTTPSVPTEPVKTTEYKDVPSSHWAYPYVSELSTNGIISGYDDGTFRPDNSVTREEFVKMIVGAAGLYDSEADCDFADVPASAWYYSYVASACANGVVNGIDDMTFGVGHRITRQDVAVIASRILSVFGKETASGDTSLTDINEVSDYAQESVKMLNSMGIINGYDDGSFMPKNTLTRAEAATIICKIINSL